MGKNVAVSRRAISRRLVKKREASFLTASIFARGASYIPHCVRSYIAVKKAVLFYTAVKRDKKVLCVRYLFSHVGADPFRIAKWFGPQQLLSTLNRFTISGTRYRWLLRRRSWSFSAVKGNSPGITYAIWREHFLSVRAEEAR